MDLGGDLMILYLLLKAILYILGIVAGIFGDLIP